MRSRTRLNKVNERSRQLISSWRRFAPEATLAGVTLAQFEVECQEPNAVQLEIVDAKTHCKGLITNRNQAEVRLAKKLVNLANAVRCDPNHGSNCAFYRSLGFVIDDERKPPTRKTAPVMVAVAPPVENVA